MGKQVPEKVETVDTTGGSSEGSITVQLRWPPKWLAWAYELDKFGVEQRGIERVDPEERRQEAKSSHWTRFLHVLGLWTAACGGLTSMSSFFLPTILFNLDMRDSLVSGLIGMIFGCLVPAYCATMGPKSGCRQMVGARLLFGQWGVKVVAVICIVGGVGWSVVNCVVGGQVLAAVANGKIPLAAGIILCAGVLLIVAVFGIRVLLRFQTILSIPVTIAALLFYIVVCKKSLWIHETNEIIHDMGITTKTVQGNWLSFFTIAYSVTATWGSGASDYYILFPEEALLWMVFLVTFLGIALPTTFVAVSGTLAGTIAYSYQPWNDAYNETGIGGIIDAAFQPWGNFGKFVTVVLYFSLICNNIMNTYSVAFEFQLIDTKLARIPRWCWALLVTVIYLVLSLVGRNEFATIISNFLPMLGYWISMYITLLLEENLLFRSTDAGKRLHRKEFVDPKSWMYLYNWDNWDKPKNITMGIAASLAFCCGVIGAVAGMNQVYWQGWIARKIGDHGGDIGFWLCGAFTGVTYPILRYFELKKWGR